MGTATALAHRSPPPLPSRQLVRLGAYEVVTRVGAGASATVHLARPVDDPERLVALRVLHPHMTSDEGFVALFVDEARVAAAIEHPNVARVHDLSSHGRLIFTVVDYVEGDTLASLMRHAAARRRPSPLGVALRVALDVLDGLHAAHELGAATGKVAELVHRDVSPKNIMVGTDGRARITDFGVARAEGRVATTLPGVIKGKLGYMAPEALEGAQLDRRADVFSLGVTLWEALTLERLFPERRSFIEARRASREPARDLRAALSDAPEALARIVGRALSVDPAQRYASAAEMAEAIRDELGDRVAARSEVSAWLMACATTKVEREREATRSAPRRETERMAVMSSNLDLLPPRRSSDKKATESDSGVRPVERASLRPPAQLLTADPLFAPMPPAARQRTMPPPRPSSSGVRELSPAELSAPASDTVVEDYSFELELSLPEAKPSTEAIVRNSEWHVHAESSPDLWGEVPGRVHKTEGPCAPTAVMARPSSPPPVAPSRAASTDVTLSLPPLASNPLTPAPDSTAWTFNAATALAFGAAFALILALVFRVAG